MRRLRHLFRKELIELRRDPRLLFIVVIAPIVQLTLLAYAATTDVRDVPVIVMDEDGSSQSRALVERFDASANFTIVGAATSPREVQNALDSRASWMALTIPRHYGARVRAGSPTTVQVVADGTDANSTNVALGYAGALVSAYAAELAASAGQAASGTPITAEVRVWFNPQLESRFFMIPGIVALLLLMVTTNLSSMAIVREREVGTLEQLSVTPIARWELIAGKLLPYGFIGMLDVALVLVVSITWFEVPLRGSPVLLFAMCGIYLLSTLGLGLFVSTISRTQQQAMMTASFFFMIPMVFLSGFVFPIENMPDVVQPVTYLVPLRYFLIILRGIFLKGVGLETLWPQALALLAWGTVVLTLATLRSSKRLG
jgi:ABC-2 type transport system permease protein